MLNLQPGSRDIQIYFTGTQLSEYTRVISADGSTFYFDEVYEGSASLREVNQGCRV